VHLLEVAMAARSRACGLSNSAQNWGAIVRISVIAGPVLAEVLVRASSRPTRRARRLWRSSGNEPVQQGAMHFFRSAGGVAQPSAGRLFCWHCRGGIPILRLVAASLRERPAL